MYRTSGDMIYNPETNQWQPIAGNPLPPFVPSGGDPVAGAGVPLVPAAASSDAHALHLEELRKLGLPLPGGQQESHTGGEQGEAPELVDGDRHVVGPPVELDTLGTEVEDPPPVDRIAELEKRPAHDTDRPPPRNKHKGGNR